MAVRDRELDARPQRWPLLLILLGVIGLLRTPLVRVASSGLADVLFTVRRLVEPAAWSAGSMETARASTRGVGSFPLDEAVLARLAAGRARVVPPPSTGWQRDGRFCCVPVAGQREPKSIALAVTGPMPPREPAFHGDELVGFTPRAGAGGPRVVPIRATGTRTPACAGIPGTRESRFLAIGDGSERLRVSFADAEVAIEEGDLAWAVDPASTASGGGAIARTVGGALLGRIVRGDAPAGTDRVDWRVAPITPLESLAELAIRHPPGFPSPSELVLAPIATTAREGDWLDRRRHGALLPVGSEASVTPGCAVSAGTRLLGLVERSGWKQAAVRTLRDPGLRCRVLVIGSRDVVAWNLATAGGTIRAGDVANAEGEILLESAPAAVDWDGALVVTAPSQDGVPEGLVLGSLAAVEERCVLRIEEVSLEDVTVWRPPSAWSDSR